MKSTLIAYRAGEYKALEEAVLAAVAEGDRRAVLDLDSLDTLNAEGVRELITLLRRARSAGGELALRSSKADVLRTLSVTALDRIFELVGEKAA